MRTYLIAMLFRTISFPFAVWALLSGWVVIGLIFAAAATFLPQIAVTIANAVDRRTVPDAAPVSPIRALPQASTPHPDPSAHRETHHVRPDGTPPADGRDAGL